MAVVLRMARHGTKGKPFYRIVAADKQKKRDGRYIELLGTYDSTVNPPKAVLKEDAIKKWISNGARPSSLVRDLIVKQFPGYIEAREKHQRDKIIANRKKRKARSGGAKAKSGKAKK